MKAAMKPNHPRLLFFLFFFLFSLCSCYDPHPLDPLTASEISSIQSIILSSPLNLSKSPTFHYVGLDEPQKPAVLSWHSDPSGSRPLPPRRAFAIVRADRQTHEIYIDLDGGSIASHRVYSGPDYPMFTNEEETAAGLLPMKYAPFLASVEKRRVKIEDVVCTAYTRGWFGEDAAPAHPRRRLTSVLCFVAGETVNLYVRPLDGITVVVDLDVMEIVEYVDRFVVPVPQASGTDFRASRQRPPYGPMGKPVVVLQPEGKGFKIHGHVIRWVTGPST